MSGSVVWRNDRFEDAAIDPSDRGLLLADGVFDTALVIDGRAAFRERHLDRLADALAALSIAVPRETLVRAHDALATRCGTGSIRLTVTRGPGPRGLGFPPEPRPTILGSAAPLAPAAMFAPLRLALSDIRRNETSPTSRVKSLAYLDAVLANHAARRAGADEALFLNAAGRLASTALANLFVVRRGVLLTPPLADGVLPGTLRGWILDNAGRLGLAAEERPLLLEEAVGAPLLATNSLRLVSPARLDEAPHEASPVLRRLADGVCAAIAAECGTDPRALGAALAD